MLAAVAVTAVVSLYGSRLEYERTLVRTSELSTAVANLSTAGIAETAILRDTPAPRLGPARRRALLAFNGAARTATAFARPSDVAWP